MASLLNEPWIKTLLDEELNEAISWKSSALPNALVKIKKEGNSNGRFAFGNDRFIDDGSNLTIRPCDGNASGHSAQIFKAVSEQEIIVSDGSMTIKAKFSTASLAEFAKQKGCPLSKKQHVGGIVQIRQFELRATPLGPAEGQIGIFVRDFQLLGSTGSPIFGRPVKAHENQHLQKLIKKAFQLFSLGLGPIADQKEVGNAQSQEDTTRDELPATSVEPPAHDIDSDSPAPLSTQYPLAKPKKSCGDVEVNGAMNLSVPQPATRDHDSESKGEKVLAELKVSDAQIKGLQGLLGQMRNKGHCGPEDQVARSRKGGPGLSASNKKPETIDLRDEEHPLQKQGPTSQHETPCNNPNIDEIPTLPDSRSDLLFGTFEDLPLNSTEIPPDQASILFSKGSADFSWHHPDAGYKFPAGPNIPPLALDKLVKLARKRHAQGFDFEFPLQWTTHFRVGNDSDDGKPQSSPESDIAAGQDVPDNRSSPMSISENAELESSCSTPIPWSPSQRNEQPENARDLLPPNSSWQQENESPAPAQLAHLAEDSPRKHAKSPAMTSKKPLRGDISSLELVPAHDEEKADFSDDQIKLKTPQSNPKEVGAEDSSPAIEIAVPRALNASVNQYNFEVGRTPYREATLSTSNAEDATTRGFPERTVSVTSSPPLGPQTPGNRSSQSRGLPETNDNLTPHKLKGWTQSERMGHRLPLGSNVPYKDKIPRHEHSPVNDVRDMSSSKQSPKATNRANPLLSSQPGGTGNLASPLRPDAPHRPKRSPSSMTSPNMPIRATKKPKLHAEAGSRAHQGEIDDPAERARIERREFFQRAKPPTRPKGWVRPSEPHVAERASQHQPGKVSREPANQNNPMTESQSGSQNSINPIPATPGLQMPELSSQESAYRNFANTYSNYTGDLKHFAGMCRQLQRIQRGPRALARSLWDDFIIRHKLDYIQYTGRCMEGGDDPVPYEEYFRATNTKRMHHASVLTAQFIDSDEANSATSQAHHSSQKAARANKSKKAGGEERRSRNRVSVSDTDVLGLDPSSSQSMGGSHPSRAGSFNGSFERTEDVADTPNESMAAKEEVIPLEKPSPSPPEELALAMGHATSAESEVLTQAEQAIDESDPAVGNIVSSEDEALPQLDEEAGNTPHSRRHSKIATGPPDERFWWQDDKTPFKEWARAYAELKLVDGAWGTTAGPRVLNPKRTGIDVLSWTL